MLHRVLVVTLALAGCAQALPGADPDASVDEGRDAGNSEGHDAAGPGTTLPDSGLPDAGPVPTTTQLLLTEVVLAPTTGELVEIANPGTSPVDLSTYYLSDAGAYFRLPAGAPTLDSGDFIAKFPAGATIAAKGVITVALDTAASFQTTYGSAPTYALSTMTLAASNGTPSLTNGGELVVLFRWDGAADNVRDVDLVLVGVPTAANGIVNKSGVVVDGPDANTTGTAYKSDAATTLAQPTAPAASKSTKRIAPEATHELHAGTGNGIEGDDETSENTAMTWDTAFTAATPGAVPAGVL